MDLDVFEQASYRLFVHQPPVPARDGIVLTHGAGANSTSALLVIVANALAESGLLVIRFDLPFRRVRPFGPPRPGDAARDRQGIKDAADMVRNHLGGKVYVAGHSYGGRQATMLCAEQTDAADALLLLSYPLHPPKKPEQLRTQHFPNLKTPSFFVHGTRDGFGSIGEMEAALKLIPGKASLLPVQSAGHDLKLKGKPQVETAMEIAAKFAAFVKSV